MRCLRFVILVLCLSLWSSLAAAQITMQVELGLQGTVRLEKWNPVTVQLHNTGPPFAGTLKVRIWRGSEFRQDRHVISFTRPVELPHRSRKQFAFDVPIASITHPLEVLLQQDEQVLLQQQFDLHEALSAEHLILGLTHDLGLDFLATSFQRHTRVVYLVPRDLPDHWAGYDSVSAVVVKGVSLHTLTQQQATALRHWIARGGNLVVAGDAQYALLQEPLLRDLLPVAVTGVQQLAGLPAFAEHYGIPMPATPLLAVRSKRVHGHLLVGTEALPLLVERNFGKGRVLFLAVDYAAAPLAGWRGHRALWAEILQPSEQIDFSNIFAELGFLDDEHPIIKLLQRPIMAYPTHSALSTFLLIYCGGLALLFWRMGRLRAGYGPYWLYTTLFILSGTGLAYSLFSEPNLRRPAILHDLSSLEVLSGTEYSHIHSYTGLFSPRGGRYELKFQPPETILQHTFYRGDRQANDAIEVTAEGPFTLNNISLAPWTLRVFRTESISLSPISAQAQRYATGLTVRVKNQGNTPLQGIVVVYYGNIFPLGSIAPGEALFQDLYLPPQAPESKNEIIWQALLKHRPATGNSRFSFPQEAILQHYFGNRSLSQSYQQPFLTGWLLAPSTIRPTATLAASGVTLIVSPL